MSAAAVAKGSVCEDVLADGLLNPRALDIDDWRLPRDRDGFLEGADGQRTIHRGHEGARQLDAFAPDGAETRQRERHRVRARAQIDHAELAGPVRDRRAHLLDENGTRDFDRHARQHAAGRIPGDAGNGGLRIRRRR